MTVDRFQAMGWRNEASTLKKEVQRKQDRIESLNTEILDLKREREDRFRMIVIPRSIGLRREHLITLHNCLEFIRRFGSLTPHTDYTAIGFTEPRTLHRSCNKFVESGLLVKIGGNPTSFTVNDDPFQELDDQP